MVRIIITVAITLLTVTLSFSQKKWSLQECVDYALEHNLTIKRNEQSNLLVNEDVIVAKNDKLPTVSGSASQNFSFGSGFDPVTNSRISTGRSSNSFGINSSIILFDGFSIKNRLKRAEKNKIINELDLEKMKNDISLNIVNSYLNILFQKERLKVAESNLEITNKLLKRTQEFIDAGVQPKGNLLEIEATRANDENRIVTSQNEIDLALLSLSQLLQISNTNFDIKEIDINLNKIELKYQNSNKIFEKALKNQPEIKSAELSIENAQTGIELAKAAFLPTVSLNAGLNTLYNHINGKDDDFYIPNPSNPGSPILVKNGFFDQLNNNFGQFVGLNVRIPIFNKFQNKSNVNRAKINQEIAKINLQNQKRVLNENIERAFINARATLKEFESVTKSLKSQELAFKFAEEKYKLGAINSFDFEQVKLRLINVKSDVIRAKYNYVFRTKLLEFYYGIPIVIE